MLLKAVSFRPWNFSRPPGMASGSTGIAYVKAAEMPACVGTVLFPDCKAAEAASQVANTAVSHTATLRVTVEPGLNPDSVAIAPGPPAAAGFQVPGTVVVEARNGDGRKDLLMVASEDPYSTAATKVVPVNGLPEESLTRAKPRLLRLIWPWPRAETIHVNHTKTHKRLIIRYSRILAAD